MGTRLLELSTLLATFHVSRYQHMPDCLSAPAPAQLIARLSVFAGLTALCLSLTGCVWPLTLVPDRSDSPDADAALQRVLEDGAAGSVHQLSTTPWGADLSLTLHPPYDAASGRWCRRLTLDPLDPQGQARPALACRARDGKLRWEPVRVLQINGQPVLKRER